MYTHVRIPNALYSGEACTTVVIDRTKLKGTWHLGFLFLRREGEGRVGGNDILLFSNLLCRVMLLCVKCYIESLMFLFIILYYLHFRVTFVSFPRQRCRRGNRSGVLYIGAQL